MKFGEHLQKFKEEQAEKKVEKRETKDDLNAAEQLVPFGLADRCYMSDTEDSAKAHRHIETSHCAIREYVDMCLTPELETAVTACLFRLRQLKMQDIGIGQKTRRYAVGFREVARLLQHKSVSALIIAPDVEKTSAGALEDKVMGLKNQCDHDGVPVIFALSRRQLGGQSAGDEEPVRPRRRACHLCVVAPAAWSGHPEERDHLGARYPGDPWR